jgi:type VI secretion system lysozyme-like protein
LSRRVFLPEPEFLLSSLDRLIDCEPYAQREDRQGALAPLSTIKTLLLADLTRLLGTRCPPIEMPRGHHHLGRSSLSYGLPDFTHLSLKPDSEKEQLRAAIESVIARFEPRLKQVKVAFPVADLVRGTLDFRVEAVLDIKPAPEWLVFDSVLSLPSRRFEVRDQA